RRAAWRVMPDGGTVHGVALLIGETGVLITGASGAGKSALALELATQWRHDPVRLIADDRVRLQAVGGRLVARPVDGFLGQAEIRGIGIARVPATLSAVLRSVVVLQTDDPERMPETRENAVFLGVSLPLLRLRQGAGAAAAFATRWPHFRA
ncbi:MAG: HPr kinase/phosphorylase, partial [Beijerinckiaceae bacterium]